MKNLITRWRVKGGSQYDFRFDHVLFFLLFLFITGLIIHLFDFYPLPTNDYIQFYKPATNILNWKPLESYKILPLYPGLIALVSLVVPNDPTLLKSMQIVIFLSALGSMVLFWRLSRRYLPRTWPIFLLVICLNPYFLEFSLQVFMEMLILVMVTLTIWMFVRFGKSVYISAGLTTLTRYDSIFLLPIISWLRFRRSGFKRLQLLLGAVAGSGILVWMILSILHSPFINPYIGEYFSTSGHALIPLTHMLGRMLIGAPPSGSNLSLPVWLLLIAFFMVIACGIFRFWKREPDTSMAIIGFILTYFAIHAAFVAALYRYNFPILPFLFFFFFITIECPASNGPSNHKVPFIISIVVMVLLSKWLISPLFQVLHVRVAWWFVLAFTTAFILHQRSRHRLDILKSLMIWTAVVLCMFPSLKTWESQYQLYRGMFSEYPAVLKWAEANCQEGQRVAMIAPRILDARYPTSRVMKYLADTGTISSGTVVDFLEEC